MRSVSRKHGRNSSSCKVYAMIGTREKNKKKKLMRHMKTHPGDLQAKRAL